MKVLDALQAAGVDDETRKMVEQAKSAGDMIQVMMAMLLGSADHKQAKNYASFQVEGLTMPFKRAYVELLRDGGLTSHEIREQLCTALVNVREKLLLIASSSPARDDVVAYIDEQVEKGRPS